MIFFPISIVGNQVFFTIFVSLHASSYISTLVIKNWLRINSLEFKNELVGKAAQWCIKPKYQGMKFSDFVKHVQFRIIEQS